MDRDGRKLFIVISVATLAIFAFMFASPSFQEYVNDTREAQNVEIRQVVDRYVAGEYILVKECPWLDLTTQRPSVNVIERYFLDGIITEKERKALLDCEVYLRKEDDAGQPGD